MTFPGEIWQNPGAIGGFCVDFYMTKNIDAELTKLGTYGIPFSAHFRAVDSVTGLPRSNPLLRAVGAFCSWTTNCSSVLQIERRRPVLSSWTPVEESESEWAYGDQFGASEQVSDQAGPGAPGRAWPEARPGWGAG